ncbi:MAG: MFS transporter [Flavobacteriales bacterium]|nr:MFS transporter [Flavobacteriales bacterium]MCB9198703.1 MFS transporter [Flavobacteriales bacterium]
MNERVSLGLKENWKQFSLLVLVNALVGAMIGMERSIFPEYAVKLFHIKSSTAILSFIVAFGLTKAIANYFTGRLSNRFGRKRLLMIGWCFAVPVPLILLEATEWWMVIFANILLGISQGFTWSSTIVMKIDLVGEKNRGLAMGLNEFSGYAAVGIMAFITGWISSEFGIVPYPFYLGLVISILGLLLTLILVKDTKAHVLLEEQYSDRKLLNNIFIETSFKDRNLSAITQAGLVNNMNDGMIWGLLPILLYHWHYNDKAIGLIVFIYPFVWGLGQLFTGKMSDHFNRRSMIFWGMLLQGLAIITLVHFNSWWNMIACSVVLGLGTALVYPTFFNVIGGIAHPKQRSEVIGIFRLWRDGGYAIGALISGILADQLGLINTMIVIGALTVLSALMVQFRMTKNV